MVRKQIDNLSIVDSLLEVQSKTDYRKELNNREPELKVAKKVEKDRSWAVEKGKEETEYNNPIARNGKSVRSARCSSEGGITNFGGSKKQAGCESNNSIWDSEIIENISKSISSKEATSIEKKSSSSIKQKKQAEYKQSISPKIGENDEGLSKKASSVSPVSSLSNGKGWVPSNKLSMFDVNDKFDRLTALENRVSPKIEKQAAKKEPKIASSHKVASSKDATDRFLNGIADQNKDTSYRSVHQDSVDRLCKILEKRNSNKES